MDTNEDQPTNRARSIHEFGAAALVASCILGLVFFVPMNDGHAVEPPTAVIATSTPETVFDRTPVVAKAAIVYDLVTGKALYEKNADAQLPLASLTKLLTVYAAFGTLAPDSPIVVSHTATQVDPPRGLVAGQTFTLADMARLTLTASLNDAAAAIAEATAARRESDEHTALASAAVGLGLSQTFALNGNGLDVNEDVSGGYGSARDVARLAGALVAITPESAAATTHPLADAVSASGSPIEVHNTDPLIDSLPRLLLSKTGYTDLAGGNLALVFDAGIMHPVAIVILGSSKSERFTDGAALVAATIAHFAGVDSL